MPFKSFTTSEGLAHDRVNKIVKDSRGFLWFCTGEGLSRFDGYEFKNYTQDDGLPHRVVMDLLETRDGNYWLATGSGLVLFNPFGESSKVQQNPNAQKMFRVFRPSDLKAELTAFSVQDLLQDSKGRIWVAADGGLYRLEKNEDWILKRFNITPVAPFFSDAFGSLVEDHTGAIWVGLLRGLFRILPDETVQLVNWDLRVNSILADSEGRIWVGSGGGECKGLYQYILSDDKAKQTRIFYEKDGLTGDHWMNALFQTSDGKIFVGLGNGLCEYTPSDNKNAKQFRKLTSESFVSLAEDSGGNLWLGTGPSGALRLARQGFVAFDETDGLKQKSIGSIVRGSDGETYIISIGERVIHRFDENRFTTVTPLNMATLSWGLNQITFQDSAGDWWIGGVSALQRYPRVNRFEDLAHTPPKTTYTTKNGLYPGEVFRLFEDSHGDIWISTIASINDSLMRWERSTEKLYGYTTANNLPKMNSPTAFGEDRAGNIWIGYYVNCLVRYRNGKFEQFTAADGLPSSFINDIYTDSAGRIWIATSTGGVVRIDDPAAEKPKLNVLTTRDGLSSNHAACVTEDNFGRIYIGTGRGVNRLDLQNQRIKLFTKTDGLPANLIRVCERDAKGAMWFGSATGLARYVPSAEESTQPPPIFIAELKANGVTAKKLSELGETEVANLELASDQRRIEIDFFALGFLTGETLRYQYKLDGAGNDWSEPTTQRTITLNLSPGAYRFLVRAVNADGVASQNPAIVSFTIARPFWQRWWVIVLFLIAISLIVYAVYRYRLRRFVELERVRTRIATDLHDDIGASLSQIAILSEVVRQKIGAEANGASEPLNLIANTSREMVDSMSDIVWAINPQKDHLSDLIQRMRRFAEDTLDAQDIEYKFTLPDASKHITLGADLRREVYLIFKESINNIIKHAEATEVDLSVEVINNSLVIQIKDNGKGFEQAEIENEYDGFGGNGLINMKRRADSLGGQFKIISTLGQGTETTIKVPLKHGKLETIIQR